MGVRLVIIIRDGCDGRWRVRSCRLVIITQGRSQCPGGFLIGSTQE